MISGLYAIADNLHRPELTPFDLAREFVKGETPIIQLRMKGAPRERLLANAKRIAALKKAADFVFIVNDDPEVAAEVDADGVHLGQGDRKVSEARKIVGPHRLIGVSTHSLAEAIAAERDEADYLACGAIFPSPSKPKDHIVIGLEGLKKIRDSVKIPVVAIGGINRSNFSQVMREGANAVAMISALTTPNDIAKEVVYFVKQFQIVGKS